MRVFFGYLFFLIGVACTADLVFLSLDHQFNSFEWAFTGIGGMGFYFVSKQLLKGE